MSVFAVMLMLLACLAAMLPAGAENSPPDIMSNPDTYAWVGHEYKYQVLAIDYDGDLLNYTLFYKPAGMSINVSSGVIKWTPTKDQAGQTHIVGIAVIDSKGAKDFQNYTIEVYEPPPPMIMLNTPYYGQEVVGTLVIEGYAFVGMYGYNDTGGEVSILNLSLEIYNMDKVVVWSHRMQIKAGGKEPNRDPNFKVEWDSTTVKDGKYFIIATVIDSDGLQGTTQADFSVHNTHTGEAVWFTSPPDGATVEGFINFKGGANKDLGADKVQIRMSTNDASGQDLIIFDWTTVNGVGEWYYGYNFTLLQKQGGGCYAVAARALSNGQELSVAKIGVCTPGISPPPQPALKAYFRVPHNDEVVKGNVNIAFAVYSTVPCTYKVNIDVADHTGATSALNFEGRANGKEESMINFTWDSTKVADGMVYFGLTATADNGVSVFSTLRVMVNNSGTNPPPQGDFKAWFDYPQDGLSVANTIDIVIGAAPNWDGTIEGALDIWDSKNQTVRFPVTGAAGNNQKITWTFSWDTTKMANGFAQLALKVQNPKGGSQVAYARANVWIDNEVIVPPPQGDYKIEFTAPKDGTTVSGKVTVTGRTYCLDKIRSIQVTIFLDGKQYTQTFTTGGGWSAFTFEIDTTKLTNDVHSLKATATLGGKEIAAGLKFVVKNGGVPPPVPPPVIPEGKPNQDGSVSVPDPEVSFKAPDISGLNGSSTTYTWDFGDGTTSHEKNPTHTYKSPGNYTVTMTADDGTTQKQSAVDLKVGNAPVYTTHVPGFGATALVLVLAIGCVATFFRRRK